MATIAAGASDSVTLPQGSTLRTTGNGTAVLGPGPQARMQIGLQGANAIGPFPRNQVIYITATTQVDYAAVPNSSTGLQVSTDASGNTVVVDPSTGKALSLGGTAATISGTAIVGGTLTASLPAGVTGTLQFTRTLTASPFTKSNIAGAVASAVNSLAYTVQAGDVGYSIGCDASNTVAASAGVSIAAASPSQPAAGTTVDVVVYGASWPGVAAAIRAKQQGRSVLLVDTRDVIGGMTRSGVQFTDAMTTPNIFRATIPESSLSNQLFAALASTYGIGQNAFFRDYSYSSESKTTGQAIDSMLAAAGITPVTNQELLSITKTGTDIDTATFSGIGVVRAKQWIEASYTGDVLAKSGADYYLGGEASSTYSETSQQAGFVIAGGQPTNAIDPYITPGNASSGLVKYVQNVNAVGQVGVAVPNKLQFPGYRLSITNTAGKKVAFPKPADWPASNVYTDWPSYANYELHRRDATANKQSATSINSFLNLQTGFPAIPSKTSGMSNKRDANNGGVFSLDFPDVALITEYFTPGCTRARRLEIEDIAWQYTLGYLCFLQNDPAVPSAARADVATYGFVNDDYLATGGRPPLMYPRETIRAVGDTPLKAGDVTAANNAVSNPCALAYYAFDKHSRQFVINTVSGVDRVVQEGGTPAAVTPSAPGARISANVLNPKKTQCSNLQVVTTPNGSQMFYNTWRLEPLMATGAEYAGIRAALAIATSTPVQDVPHTSVATIHNLYGLDPVGGTCATVDGTTRTQGTLTTQGTWSTSTTNICGTTSIASCSAASGTNTFTYTPQVPATGTWKIQIKYLDSSPSGLTRGTFTTVATVGGVAQPSMTINQNSATAGVTTNGDWQTVYTGTLSQGDTLVGTYNNSGNAGNIVAARIVPG